MLAALYETHCEIGNNGKSSKSKGILSLGLPENVGVLASHHYDQESLRYPADERPFIRIIGNGEGHT